jgi:glycosyltransferase involved in cell wall biosynthesis
VIFIRRDLRARTGASFRVYMPGMNPSSDRDPRVAICMATHNPQQELFRRQIESIREQSHENWICLVSDDDSRPDAFATIKQTVGDDPRFRVERNPTRLGVYRNFENVLSSVPDDAELVALADQDDRWEPDKLGLLADRIAAGATLAYSDMRIVGPDGEVVSPTFWTNRRNNTDDLGALVIANSITGAASVFRSQLLEYILPFPDATTDLMHDHWIAMVAMSLGPIAYLDRPLYDYVQHPGAALGHEGLRRPGKQGSGAVPGRSLRERAQGWLDFMRRGYRAVLQVRAAAETLLRRGGESIPPRKRRVLRRCARIQRSPAGWAWLALMIGRSQLSGSKTMGAERFLLAGVLWQVMPGKRKLSQPPPQNA